MNTEPNPQQQLMQLVMGKLASQAVTMAAEFGFADHLKDGPRSAAQLATASGCDADATYRLLRAHNRAASS